MAITNFMNLADIYREADRGRAAQRQEDQYQRGRQQEQTLADIFSQQRGMDPSTLDQGSEYVKGSPEISTGTGGDGSYSTPPTGEYSPAVAEQAARPPNHALNSLKKLEHAAMTKRETSRKLGERGFGSLAAKVSAEADAIDEKIWQHREKITGEKAGAAFTNYTAKVQEGASGRSDPLNVAAELSNQLGRPPTRSEVQASYRKQLPDMYAPTSFAPGAVVQDRGNPRGAGVRNTVIIPDITSTKLTDLSSNVDDNEFLLKNFKPSYGGHLITRDWQKKIEAMFSNDPAASNFWATQARMQNKERHTLFGGALTPVEFQEWKNQAIDPGMTAPVIRARLEKQNEVLKKSARRLSGGLQAEGKYDRDSILQYLGGREDLMRPMETKPIEQPQNNKLPPKDQLKADGKTRYQVNGKMMLWNGRGFVE